MYKKAASLMVLFMIICGTFLYAEATQSDFYPKTVAINRVYPHTLGYRVDYIKSNRTLGTFYAPTEWFKKAAGYGEIVYGNGAQYPYATFYYKDGKIDHFRLYLISDFNDQSWGVLRGEDYNQDFDISELNIEY
jgi:hypothetical protein